jgi:protein O-GlcNAc transferase
MTQPHDLPQNPRHTGKELQINRLRRAFADAAIDFDERVCTVPVMHRERFFGLMSRASLMLDTLGFSGFNTALQGIECGLPVLAYEGEFMRGRLASGIMRRLELAELVATSRTEFITRAIELAADQDGLQRLRAEIVTRRSVLFRDVTPVQALGDRLAAEINKHRGGTAST